MNPAYSETEDLFGNRGAGLRYRLLYLLCGICYIFCLLSSWGLLKAGEIEVLRVARNIEEGTGEQNTDENNGAAISVEKEKESEAPQIALTFDDGPNPKSTPILLDGLKERGVKVTFFVIGVNAEKYPEIVKRENEEGHIVGNHTYHHVEITKLTEEEAEYEIMRTSDLVEIITGRPTEFMRPPFGVWQKKMELELEVMPVLWTVDPLDWTTENEDEIVNKVVTDVEENDIILLHDCYLSSVNAALRIIDILQKEGYEFVTVDELLLN